MKKLVFIYVCMAVALSSYAQGTPCKITDSGELYSTFAWTSNTAARTYLEAVVGESKAAEIIKYSNENNWPQGIATLDGRNTNRPKIADYVVKKVADISAENMVVLSIKPADNGNMPINMRPTRTIYFAIGDKGVNCPSIPTTANKVSSAHRSVSENLAFTGLLPIKIIDPGSLMSTYSFEAERDDLIDKTEFEDEDIDLIIKKSNEKEWPVGISTLTARDKTRKLMPLYHLYLVTYFGKNNEDAILYCPANENQHVQADMRPDEDIFFVYKTEGVELVDE